MINFGVDGRPERTYSNPVVQRISVFAQEVLLGWARGYCVDTVGLNSEMIQKYVKFQEKEELRQEQLLLEPRSGPSQKSG